MKKENIMKMNNQMNIHWTIMFMLVLTLLPGCSDLLTEVPKDSLTPDNFYRSASDADAAVAAIYSPLVDRQAFENYLYAVNDVSSDIGRIGYTATNAPNIALNALEFTPDNVRVADPWGQFYRSISRANLAIDQIPQIQMEAERKAALVGEAKFLRALNYFFLVRLYGDVPLITSSSELGLEVVRTSKDEVYQQIIQDAQDAAQALPLEWNDANQGRATQGAALTLLAKVHLTLQEWQQAADYAQQIIELGVYRLYDNYLHAFLPDYENGPEHVFSLQFGGRGVAQGSHHVAMYYPREAGPRQGGGFGFGQPSQWHYESYIAEDYRKEVTYKTHWVNFDGEEFDLYPHVFKYRPSQISAISGGDTDVPLFRYAEVLLIYAEALNELGNSAEATEYLNMIRERARNGTGNEDRAQPADYIGPMTQNAVREAIFQERRWELAHECKRWFDLIRRGEDYFLSQIETHDPGATDLEATDMLLPIPQSEMDVNPNLTQNPGY